MKKNANRRVAYRNLPQLFLQARERLMIHFRPLFQHFGLTEQQWRVLRALDEQGELEPWELCEACHFHSSSMAGILARMTEMKLIVRHAVPEDQRRLRIALSAKGDRTVRDIAPLIDRQYRYLEQALGERMDRLAAALEDFIAADMGPVKKVDLPAAAGDGK
ncbi:MarR family transcriptional regulator [Noviherbaspirillum aridicola]|uniref:Homoprotocatechuate degradation operon regulator, HpaR n=1 Tax=Noviherbaspirillum aridicola TaxID=2849687 RepID=A0ABQ4Q689_9BURK|nr:MarR family transcriptional regulator [Noviherbaspirillum aridicola]GIZ52733.1 homoprotocatechuate degradation operon regulator, HpaR [Noviherbaspirillum aridicola]